jgi:hypothetical protein
MRRLVLSLVLGLALAGVATAAATSTAVHRFVAFRGKTLAGGLQAGKTSRGYCWEGSMADYGRSDAWRCFRGNEILDPCFSRGASSRPYLVCARTPWLERVVLLRLTKPLPLETRNHDQAETDPWALATANGRRCTLITGATSLIRGRRISYGCSDDSVLLGSPRRQVGGWTILWARDVSTSTPIRVGVTEAWS